MADGRERFRRFRDRRLDAIRETAKPSLIRDAEWIHDRLVEATVAVPEGPPRRRQAMTLAGVPIVYSLKLARSNEDVPFRMLVEPGGTAIDVHEHFVRAQATLEDVLHELGWTGAVEHFRWVAAQILPRDTAVLNGLRGAMWIGMAVGPDELDIRAYLTLRHGEDEERWKRLERVMERYGDARSRSAMDEIRGRAARRATPVGVCLAAVDGRIRGFRTYITFSEPTIVEVCEAIPDRFGTVRSELEEFAAGFSAAFGAFTRQSVSSGYDFVFEPGFTSCSLSRFKLELSCQALSSEAEAAVPEWIESWMSCLGIDPTAYREFGTDMETCHSGSELQYVTLGASTAVDHATVYVNPIPASSTL